MLSNEVFSKNPYGNIFIKQTLEGTIPPKISVFFVIQKLFTYYKKSFKGFYFYIVNLFVYLRYAKRFDFSGHTREELIVVDTFFIIEQVLEKRENFCDTYFRLDDILHSMGKQYVYLPVFYGLYSPSKMKDVFINLKNSNLSVVYEYDLLKLSDYFKILFFIFRYPIKIILFSLFSFGCDKDDKLLRFALIESLANVTFHKHIRYLQGKRFDKFNFDTIKMISWFENQTIDKNLYKGIRDCNLKTYIIGSQLLIFPSLYMNMLIDEAEDCFNLIPDKVLVNGSHYLPKSDRIKFEVGPSLRYGNIFSVDIPPMKERSSVVILLSYLLDDARRTLELCKNIDFNYNVILKPHPTSDLQLFTDLIKSSYMVVDENIYQLASKAKFIITAATGSMVEMAAMGVVVISVKPKTVFEYNPMTELGKGVLWHEVSSREELCAAISSVETTEESNIKRYAKEYKEAFFCKPSQEIIMKAFEL